MEQFDPMERCILRVTPQKRPGKTTVWWLECGLLRLSSLRKSDAVLAGRRLALQHNLCGGLSQLVIHKADGQIQKEWTYGEDPPENKG